MAFNSALEYANRKALGNKKGLKLSDLNQLFLYVYDYGLKCK